MWLICFRQFSPMGKSCWCLEESTYPLGGAFWAQSREMGFIDQRLKPIVPSLSGSQDCLFKTFLHQRGLIQDFPHCPAHHRVPMGRPLRKESSSSPGSPWLCSHSPRAPEPFAPGRARWPSEEGTTVASDSPWTPAQWCCRMSPACRLVLALLPGSVVSVQLNSVHGCTELAGTECCYHRITLCSVL